MSTYLRNRKTSKRKTSKRKTSKRKTSKRKQKQSKRLRFGGDRFHTYFKDGFKYTDNPLHAPHYETVYHYDKVPIILQEIPEGIEDPKFYRDYRSGEKQKLKDYEEKLNYNLYN